MDSVEFCKHTRESLEPVRIDDVVIDTGVGLHHAHGTVQVREARFLLRLTLKDKRLKMPPCGLYSAADFWRITGLIDDEVPFLARGMPHSTSHGVVGAKYYRMKIHTDKLSLAPNIVDQAEDSENEEVRVVDEYLQRINLKRKVGPSRYGHSDVRSIQYRARLTDYKLTSFNDGSKSTHDIPLQGETTESTWNVLRGEFEGCQFSLRQVEEDCLINLKSETNEDKDSESFEELSNNFLQATAFVFGQDAWPQEREIEIGFRKQLHIVSPPRKTNRSRYPLLNESSCAHGANAVLAIQQAGRFFADNKALSDPVKQLLHLARSAACPSTPFEVGTLALCSIFEGVVDVLHSQYCKVAPSGEEMAFLTAKKKLLSVCKTSKEALDESCEDDRRAFERLGGLIGSAKYARTKEKFVRLIAHFRLDWQLYKTVLESWNQERNPLAHGKLTRPGGGAAFASQELIAAGINVLVAAAMGYHGLVIFPTKESSFARI